MEQHQIDRYVDNLDVNTQADLLKKVLNHAINHGKFVDEKILEDMRFIANQISEFNKQFKIMSYLKVSKMKCKNCGHNIINEKEWMNRGVCHIKFGERVSYCDCGCTSPEPQEVEK